MNRLALVLRRLGVKSPFAVIGIARKNDGPSSLLAKEIIRIAIRQRHRLT